MAQLKHGFFGKLPNVGDFVGRGWTAEARNGLDRLLREALAELLGTQDPAQPFEHETSFALSIAPGVVCPDGFMVVVIPSEDRVGRRFPLAAGVHWSMSGPATPSGWPSNDYIKALVVAARQQLVMGLESDLLQAAITRVGNPAMYEPTFVSAGGDETLPRLDPRTQMICVQGRLCRSLTGAPCAVRGVRRRLRGARVSHRQRRRRVRLLHLSSARRGQATRRRLRRPMDRAGVGHVRDTGARRSARSAGLDVRCRRHAAAQSIH